MLHLLKKSLNDDLWWRKTALIAPSSIMTPQSELKRAQKSKKHD